jgi:hypothetical protein
LSHTTSMVRPVIALPEKEQSNKNVSFLPFQIGRYQLAIEAQMIVSLGGPELKELLRTDPTKGYLPAKSIVVPLAEVLGEPEPEGKEFLTIKAGQDGERVLFLIDAIDRILHIPLQNLRALPPVTKEIISVPFIWGLAIVEDVLINLIDPEQLYHYGLRRGTDD